MLFTFVLASALHRHLDISCGCFSNAGAGKISYLTLIRAIVITLISAAAYAGTILFVSRQWQPPLPEPRSKGGLQSENATNDTGLLLSQE